MATSKRCAFLLPPLIILFLFIVSFVSILSALFLFKERDSNGNVQYCVPFISNCHNLDNKTIGKNETAKMKETPYSIWQQSMNPELDPCEDFYQFSCSKYEASKRDNEEPSYLRRLSDNQTKKCFLDTFYSQKSNSSSAVQKMRRYQEEYERTKSVSEEISIQDLIDEINSFGSCPALSLDNELKSTNIIDRLLKMTNLTGLPYLYEIGRIDSVGYGIYPSIKPARLIFFDPSTTLKSSSKMWRQNDENTMRNFFVQIFELIAKKIKSDEEEKPSYGYENPESSQDYYGDYHENESKNYTNISQKLIDLEIQLIGIYDKWGYFNSSIEQYKFSYLNQTGYENRLGIYNIETYLFNNSLISTDLNKYFYQNGYHIGNRTRKHGIFIHSNFLFDLASVFEDLDIEILTNYLCLRYIIDRMPYLNEDFKRLAVEFDAYFEWEAQILPKYNEDTRKHVELKFPLVSNHLFVTHCQSSLKQLEKVREVVENVLSVSLKMIQKAEWLDSVSKENVLAKLNSMLIFIGGSSIVFNQTKLDVMYEKLDFEETDGVMKMDRKLRLFNSWQSLSILHTHDNYANFKALEYRSTENNAYANRHYPLIIFPLGGLFSPNFDVNQPYSNNYGTVGWIAGHEIFHLLDFHGVNYLFNGSYQSIFGDPETKADFEERVFCLLRQYDRQKDLSGLSLDGEKTVNEDVADNAGIKVAYYAYLEHLKKNGDKKVSGYSNYTHEQSFFISYATRQCSTIPLSIRKWKIKNNDHTLPEYRINMPLRNFPEFSKAFNCPVGSKMNPKKKCQVW